MNVLIWLGGFAVLGLVLWCIWPVTPADDDTDWDV